MSNDCECTLCQHWESEPETEPEPEALYAYTWQDAVDDGTFVQLSGAGYPAHGDAWVPQMVAEAGIRFPLAVTREVFHDCVAPLADTGDELAPTQDIKGRLWDLLSMLKMAIRRSTAGGSDLSFELHVVKNCPAGKAQWTRPRKVTLCASCGPRSMTDPAPVLTVFYPEQR